VGHIDAICISRIPIKILVNDKNCVMLCVLLFVLNNWLRLLYALNYNKSLELH